MADPSSPTRAEGPDELERPSSASAARPDQQASPGDAAPAAGTNGSPSDHVAEAPPSTTAAADEAPAKPAEPTATEPTATEPTATEPTATEPTATEEGSWPGSAPDDGAGVESVADEDGGGEAGGGDGGDGGDGPDDGAADEGSGRRPGLLEKQVQLNAKTILVVVGFLVLAVGAYLLGQRQAKDGNPTAQTRPTVTTTFEQPTEFVPFVDEETGIKLSIPKEWTRRSTKNLGPEARLLAEVPNTQDTLLVRVNAYSKEVTKENLGDQKAFIDTLFAEEKQLTVMGVEAGELNGMPVLVYVYRFPDPSGAVGIHAHYFVFQGRKAVQMVFQALPEEHYTSGGLGVVWGKISESLEVTPGPPPAFLEQLGGTAPTTAPGGATTAPGATNTPPPSAPPSTG